MDYECVNDYVSASQEYASAIGCDDGNDRVNDCVDVVLESDFESANDDESVNDYANGDEHSRSHHYAMADSWQFQH